MIYVGRNLEAGEYVDQRKNGLDSYLEEFAVALTAPGLTSKLFSN
jgi:hypothetical protein